MEMFLGLVFFAASTALASSTHIHPLGLPEGELCKFVGDREWRCRKLEDCQREGLLPVGPITSPVCSYGRTGPVVCCPSPPRVQPRASFGAKAKSYCERMGAVLCNSSANGLQFRSPDNDIHTSIAGGTISMAGDHPYMALLGYGDTKEWMCGGTLISERFVVSAAHCAKQGGGPKVARLGDLDYSTDEEESDPQELAIAEVIIHPDFKDPVMYHDIALFKLERDVKFTAYVRPACLNVLPRVPYKDVTAAGWGRTGYVEDVSAQLRTVDLSMVNQTMCNRLRRPGPRIPQGINGTIMICAGEEEGIRDTCQGDSGGPLVVEIGQRCLKSQVGVTSFGGICALPNSPGVYTRVSHYVPWIESIVWP